MSDTLSTLEITNTPTPDRKEVAFIDTGVTGWETLAGGVRPGVDVVLLDAGQSGLAQMAEWAANHSGYDAIHVLGHGAQGAVLLGSDSVTHASLANQDVQEKLAALGQALTADGDLLLYGCDVAEGQVGLDFVAKLAQITGADVAASVDTTGSALRGGDWVLESVSGNINVPSLSNAAFEGLLATQYVNIPDPLASAGAQTAFDGFKSIASIDYDADGDTDFIAVDSSSSFYQFYNNNGSGSFAAVDLGVVLPFVSGREYTIADFDNDGDQDILAPNPDAYTSSYFINNGSGNFTQGADPLAAAGAQTAFGGVKSVSAIDYDADGDTDFITYNGWSYQFYSNNGSGSFAAVNPGVALPLAYGREYTIADFDNDGDQDILAPDPDTGTSSYFINNGNGIFTPGADPLAAAGARTGSGDVKLVSAIDYDVDGDTDFIAYNGSPYQFYSNNGSGSFDAVNLGVSLPFVYGAEYTIADFDNDGDQDILAPDGYVNTSSYFSHYGTVAGTNDRPPRIFISSPTDNATSIAGSSNIVLTFDETISSVGSGAIRIYKASDNSLVESIAGNDSGKVGISGAQVTINPAATLADGTDYYVLIGQAAFFDADGMTFQGISQSSTLNFTTASNQLPTISSVTAPSNGSYQTGDVLSFTVATSAAITVTGTPRIALTLDTGGTVHATYASGSGTSSLTFSYTVASGELDTNGIGIATSIDLNGGTLKDGSSNDLTLTYTAPTLTGVLVDGVLPTVTGITSSTSNGAYNEGDTISIQVAFSESVTVTGTPQLTLETGAIDRVVNYVSGTGTNTLTFTYTVQAGDSSADLDYAGTTALALNSGTIKDAAGNNATLTLASSGAANSLGANKAIVIDTTAPTAATPVRADLAAPTGTSFTFSVSYDDASGAGLDSSTFGMSNVTVKDPSNNSLTVSNATASGNTVTYTVTPPGGSWDSADAGTYTIGIVGNSVKDLAGNAVAANTSAKTFAVTYRDLFTITGNAYDEFQTVTDGSAVMTKDATGLGTGDPVTVTFGSVPLGTTTAAFNAATSNLYGDASTGDVLFVPTLRDANSSYNDESSFIIESLTHSFDFSDFTYFADFVDFVDSVASNIGTYTIKGYYKGVLVDTVVINSSDGTGTAAADIGSKFTGNGKQVNRVIIEASDGTAEPPYYGYNHFDLANFTPLVLNVSPAFVGATTTLTVDEGTSATDIKSLLHASDSDGSQTLTWTESSAPSHGSLSFSSASTSSGSSDVTPGGTITYTPTTNYAGSDSFTVQVSDGSASATRTVNVTVNDVNPSISNATLSVNENASNGTSVGTVSATGDTNGLAYSITSGNTGSVFAINSSTGEITVANPINYEGSASYSLTVAVDDEDADTTADATATITVNLNDVNEAPTAVNDLYDVQQNATLSISLVPVLDQSQTTFDTGIPLGANAVVYQTFTAGKTGDLKSITLYQNGLPETETSSSIRIYEGAGLGGALLSTSDIIWLSASSSETSNERTVTFSAPAYLKENQVYTLNIYSTSATANIVGAEASSYAGGNLFHSDYGGNLAWDLWFKTYVEPAVGGVLLNDTDPEGDKLSLTAIRTGAVADSGTAGTLGSPLTGTYGVLTINSFGAVTYQANNAHALDLGETVDDVFTYTMQDAVGATKQAELKVRVTGVNDTPTLTSVSTLTGAIEDTAYTISHADLAAAANEADAEGATLSFRVEAVASGTLTKGGVAVTPGTTLLGTGESLVWKPAANANGLAINAFTVKAHDGGLASATAVQVAVDVAAVNDAPTLSGSPYSLTSTDEDTSSSGTLVSTILAGRYADVDSGALSGMAVTTKGGNGSWQYSTDGTNWTAFGTVTSAAALLLASTSQVRYVPDGNNGGFATLSFRAWDQTSGTASSNGTPQTATNPIGGGNRAFSAGMATASLVVSSVNDAPSNITLSASSLAENTSTTSAVDVGTLSSTDVDTGDTLFSYSIVGGSDQGVFQISGNNLQFKAGTVLDYEAQNSYSVTVRTTDAGNATHDKTFSVALTDVNDAPTVANALVDQTASATQAFSYVFANDSFADQDIPAQTLTYTATRSDGTALPTWLTFTPATRTFSGTPTVGDAGTLSVKVTATDNGTGTLSVTDSFDIAVANGLKVSSIVPAGSATVAGSATSVDYTVTFSEAVTGVDATDFAVTGATGTASGSVGSVSGSGSTYTVTVNSLGGDGTLRLDLNSSGTDIVISGTSAAIASGYTSGQTYTLDHTAPALTAVSIASSNANTALAKVGDTITVTFTTDGTHSGIPTATIAGQVATVSLSSGNTYTATHTLVSGDTEGAVVFAIHASDAVGNAMTAVTATTNSSAVNFDKTAPIITLSGIAFGADTGTSASDFITHTAAQTISATLSGTPAGTDKVFGSLDNGATWVDVTSLVSGTALSWTGVTLTGSSTLKLKVTDAAGNDGTVASQAYALDSTRPALASAITLSDTALKVGDSATVTFAFTEVVTGFTVADVTAPNGTLSSLASADGGITWTATLTPSAGTTAASNVLTLDYTGLADLAGNAGTGTATSGNYAVDTARPTLASAITLSDTALKVGDSATVTFAFTEAVTGFTVADVTAPNGTLSGL
ncbi:DUF4347 domain-containing protein, partial [Malikia sp.]|uniref:DUF4347 domain-containing protein n=1 Tax=Malikia sp. TaxID=2070706 RepID=UPI00262FC4F5